jgi:hypothetical protein
MRLASQRLQILTCYGRNPCLRVVSSKRRFLFLPGKRSNHPLFGLGQNNAKAVMTLEPAEIPAGLHPDVLNHGSTRAGETDNLASIQVPQSTNSVHVSRLQEALQAGRSNVTAIADYLCSKLVQSM